MTDEQFEFWTHPQNWVVSYVKCDTCTHDWVGVRLDYLDKLECPNCHNLTTFEILKDSKIDE